MCSGDDTNNLNILIDLGFRTENQVQLPFMSPVPVVSALGHMKSSGSGDDIEQRDGEARMSKPPIICIPGFHLFFLASSVPVAMYSVSI